MSQSKKQMVFKTPQGTAMYPWLNNPDTQFDTAGQYKVDLRMSKDDAKELVSAVKAVAEEAFGDKAKSAALPFKTDEETGDIIVKTKSKYKPGFVDSQGMKLGEQHVPNVYGGSTLKLSGQMYPYKAGGRHGVSMQLGGVQLIKLAESATSNAMAFEPVEGGYVAAANDNEVSDSEGGYNF